MCLQAFEADKVWMKAIILAAEFRILYAYNIGVKRDDACNMQQKPSNIYTYLVKTDVSASE